MWEKKLKQVGVRESLDNDIQPHERLLGIQVVVDYNKNLINEIYYYIRAVPALSLSLQMKS